jgi:translation initiation factor IF-3
MPKKYYQINQYIKATELRVVDEKAAQIGVMTKDEALSLATEQGLDLILVSAQAKPPVAKIINFAKFKYQQQQKDASSKKSTKNVEIKEIRLTPFIGESDFEYRMKKAREYLETGNKVRIQVKFVGRQITHKEFGDKIMKEAIDELSNLSTVERSPQFQGKLLIAQLQSKKK